MTKKAVIVFSGGQDSTTCLIHALGSIMRTRWVLVTWLRDGCDLLDVVGRRLQTQACA